MLLFLRSTPEAALIAVSRSLDGRGLGCETDGQEHGLSDPLPRLLLGLFRAGRMLRTASGHAVNGGAVLAVSLLASE